MMEFAELLSGALWIYMGLYVLINIFFAIGVSIDAKNYQMRGRTLFLCGGGLWALATLLGGVPMVAAYWLIHYSSLRSRAGVSEEALGGASSHSDRK